MFNTREDFDNLVWDANDEEWSILQPEIRRRSTITLLEELVTKKMDRQATWVAPMNIGGYNIVYRLHLENPAADVIVRRPILCYAKFPREKTYAEVTTARYLERYTKIPVPKVLFCGEDDELGWYIIMEYVEHKHSMSTALNATNEDPNKPFILDPNIPQELLEATYQKVAHCLLELSQHTLPLIGSLTESKDSPFTYSISSRPITRNMNDMLQLAGIPSSILPAKEKTFSTADEYYTALARQHIAQLVFQHNDLVSSAHDCRNKYVSRLIFLRLAKQGKLSIFGFREDTWSASAQSPATKTNVLSSQPPNTGAFRLYFDDLRAGNILLDDKDDVAAVIDWEFTYAAPTQFSLDPPWWLVLEGPEMWDEGLDDWVVFYEPRLEIWLEAMRKAEAAFERQYQCRQPESESESEPESGSRGSNLGLGLGLGVGVSIETYMRESWETGRFWLSYAARNSWAFDAVYWGFLDERFFGGRPDGVSKDELWQTRVGFLSVDEREAMETFVDSKMGEVKERRIVEWSVEDAKRRLDEILLE